MKYFLTFFAGVLVTVIVSCVPTAAPTVKPVTPVALQQYPGEPVPTPRPQDGPTPCAESATDRTWRAYEESRDELRWYEFFHGLEFYIGDKTRKKWPKELSMRRIDNVADLVVIATSLHTELERHPQGIEKVSQHVEKWEAMRDRIRKDRIAYVDDIFRIVYKTEPPTHLIGIVPLERQK